MSHDSQQRDRLPSQPPIDERPGVPSFQDLGPLLDRLVELAEQELPDPYMVSIQGWDDGDFTAWADHSHGIKHHGSPVQVYERVEYDTDKEAFVYGYIESNKDTGDSQNRETRVLEQYPCPVPLVA